ncbi:MAG: hypothetical protein GYA17_19600 [Chloroflexi bacterium]|jgi:hypothetical protein|nr:hypothetical protein [Anaerolineaceae bacterium]NMB90573.1 hypothetical protein [Chloroflexota bacterium]
MFDPREYDYKVMVARRDEYLRQAEQERLLRQVPGSGEGVLRTMLLDLARWMVRTGRRLERRYSCPATARGEAWS